jgi:hypothetical protein
VLPRQDMTFIVSSVTFGGKILKVTIFMHFATLPLPLPVVISIILVLQCPIHNIIFSLLFNCPHGGRVFSWPKRAAKMLQIWGPAAGWP